MIKTSLRKSFKRDVIHSQEDEEDEKKNCL